MDELFSTGFTGIGTSAQFIPTLYPNPVGDMLNVTTDFTMDKLVWVRISDVGGRCVYQSNIVSEKNLVKVPVAGLRKGVYQLFLGTDEKSFTLPLIIKE